ncbi:MAG: Chromophore lyase CpcT/CpeT [Steroidobacteraceae bacterium]|nr:Chromophore lyase CpcT/CpeT [Steroidobacteraceae bacterium]
MNAAVRAIAVVMAAVGACGAVAATPADGVALLAAWWPGIYDTSEQLVYSRRGEPGRAEGSELRVRTIVSRIALPWLGDNVLYAEEFLHDDPEDPRRQVLLRLEPNAGGGVRVRQYTLRDPARFRHLHRSPRLIASLRADDIESSPGCDLVLRREVTQFVGGTEGNACRDDAPREARYIDYRVVVGQDLYWYRRRHFRVADNELEDEIAGYTWFQLHEARLFTCRVRWSANGQHAGLRDLLAVDVHDQGGRARFRTPDGHELAIELHAQDWPFAAERDALILILDRIGANDPLASAWAPIGSDAIAIDLGWIAVRCAAVVPQRPVISG